MSFPSGFLIVDKPQGVTSFSMVSLVRRLTGVKRVGHAGTLDPLASGVLPVAVGHATRFIEYLDDAPKTYAGSVRFGVTTETYDAEGEVTATADASGVTGAAIEAALPAFAGEIEQTPPRYSALKVAGKPLYRYAREGADVTAAPRRVYVQSIVLRRFADGLAEIEVTCGKGTYIRSIAHDLGQRLGCGAHLAALRRTSSGGFGIELTHVPETLIARAGDGRLDELLLAVDRALERRPAAIVGPEHGGDIASGRTIELAVRPGARAIETGDLCRAYGVEGGFLGVLQLRDGGRWHPQKVVPKA